MDAEEAQAPEEALEVEVPSGPGGSPEALTVRNGSQVIAVTLNLNLPIFGWVVYANRRAIPPAVGGRIFDVVRRVVGGPPPEGPEAELPEATHGPRDEEVRPGPAG